MSTPHPAPLPYPPRPPRIASLVPSLTELLVALGLRDFLVARTGFCIHPAAELRDVPKVGGTKDVNLAKLKRLAPTHVLVNVDENRLETVDAIRAFAEAEVAARGTAAAAPQLIVTHPCGPDDNVALIEQLLGHFGHLDGVAPRGAELLRALREELALTCPNLRANTHPDAWPEQRVLYLIWRAPWMTVARDTYLSRMLARINWLTWPDQTGGASGAARYPVIDANSLRTAAAAGTAGLAEVQRVLLSSEPYAFGGPLLEQYRREAALLCPNARVQLVDGELLSWYGARAIPGLRYLRELADAPC